MNNIRPKDTCFYEANLVLAEKVHKGRLVQGSIVLRFTAARRITRALHTRIITVFRKNFLSKYFYLINWGSLRQI